MAYVRRIENGKRITVRDADGKAVVIIKPRKKRVVKYGSIKLKWELVISHVGKQ